MKKKIAVLVAVVVALVALSMGCVEVEETTTVNVEDEDDTWSNQSQKNVSVVRTTEKVWVGTCEKTVIIGRLTGVTFNYKNLDVLVFQDGKDKAVFCAKHAENFVWKVGKTHKVTIEFDALDGKMYIRGSEIVNDTQITQSVG